MCTCASCKYTDSFADKGFDAWPKGEPAGKRASEAIYAAHARHVWIGSYKSVQFTPGQAPKFPSWVTSSYVADGGAHRSYPDPERPDTREGWTTAAYVEAFTLLNGYVTAEKIAKREAERRESERQQRAHAKSGRGDAWPKRVKKPTPRLLALAQELRRAA